MRLFNTAPSFLFSDGIDLSILTDDVRFEFSGWREQDTQANLPSTFSLRWSPFNGDIHDEDSCGYGYGCGYGSYSYNAATFSAPNFSVTMYDEPYNGEEYETNDVWHKGRSIYGGGYSYSGTSPVSHIQNGSLPTAPSTFGNTSKPSAPLIYAATPNFNNYATVNPKAILDEKCTPPPIPDPPAPAAPKESPTPPAAPVSLPEVTIIGAFWNGLKTGGTEVVYKASLPLAWAVWKSEFKCLADARDNAWEKSGLDGTWTQTISQGSATVGVGAAYAAVGGGVLVRAIGNKTVSAAIWEDLNLAHPGFSAMSAFERGCILIEKQGFKTALMPTVEGVLLGTTTKMPWVSHLPSVETILIGVPAGSAILYGIYEGVHKGIGNRLYPYYERFFGMLF